LALLNGNVDPKNGTIDNFMLKGQVFDEPTRLNNGTGPRPQRAVTEYKVLSNATSSLSWVKFSPKTDRTHQLRLHRALTLNAPIVGDSLYGRNQRVDTVLQSMLQTNNLFLFAYKITFQHPSTGRMMTLRASVPEFMMPVMKFLEFKLP
jgi:23S rRNA-/tRNA-specific pseudouridylate synthase